MARFGQYFEAYRKIGLWELCKRVYSEMNDDGILTWASALAYSWMLALFPLIIFLLTLVAFIPGDKVKMVDNVNSFIARSLPGEASKILTDNIPDVIHNQHGGLLTVGALLTLWAASGGMATTMSALNRCYDITEDQAFYIARPKAVVLTIVLIGLVLFVLIALPIGGFVLDWFKAHGGTGLSAVTEMGLELLRWTLALAAMFLIVSIVYYFGPRLHSGFRYITPGSAFTVLGWILLGSLFRLYFTSFGGAHSYSKTYGAVGGIVILLLFIYAASTVLLLGAEVNSEFDYAMYGRTGGLAGKPGEKADGESSESMGNRSEGSTAPQMKPASGSSPARPACIVGPAFTAKAGLPPEASRDKVECPPVKTGVINSLVKTSGVVLAGAIAGYILHRPSVIFKAKLTPRSRLPKVYPATYNALKFGARA